MATEVINLKNKDDVALARQQGRLVFVGRPSPWGNPFSWRADTPKEFRVANRDEAIARYKEWLLADDNKVDEIKRTLKGKALACYCAPAPCHADVLFEIVEGKQVERKVVDTVDGVDVYEKMKALGASCDECPLKGRHIPVGADPGVGKSKLIVIGEGPGMMEIKSGRPFVGPSGQLLNATLAKAGMPRSECYVTNAAACRGDTEAEKERAAACCAMRLANELQTLDPDKKLPLLTLGAPAAKVMLGRGSIFKTRGFIWTLPEIDQAKVRAAERTLERRRKTKNITPASIDRAEQGLWRAKARAIFAGRTCIPTIHPAHILRGGEALLPILRVDMRRAVRAAAKAPEKLPLIDEGHYVVAKTVKELKKALKQLRTRELLIDVETLGPDSLRDKMTMLGIGEVPNVGSYELAEVAKLKLSGEEPVSDDDVRVVLASPPRDTPKQRRASQKVLREMGKVINAFIKGKIIIGHNLSGFDMLVLPRYGIKPEQIRDSLVAHHTYASHMRQGLDHLVSMYTDASPWKINFKLKGAEEKGGVQSKWMSSEDLDKYNAADVRGNAVSWRRMQGDLESERGVYEQDMGVAEICRGMGKVGFAFDKKKADDLSQQLDYKARALLGQMRGIVGNRHFHPARPAELRAALFGKFKVTPIMITATGLASTAAGTLESLRSGDTRAGRLADLILRWRGTQKTRATFVDGVEPHADGRIHPSWKSFGTVTGRLACRGPNLMNLPRWSRALEDRVRELYIAAPGCVLVYFDLSQSEMRMAAYLSGDENFIASCESGDVHTSNAMILFPDAREALTRDPKGTFCPRHGETGDGRSECNCGKPFRDVAKNAGFGILYCADVETIYKFLLSRGFDVTLADCEAMFAQIHSVYSRYYAFVNENMEFCKKHGHLREFFSRRIRWLGWYPGITDVSNYPIQGGIAGLMNMRLLQLAPRIPPKARLVAQVHDAIIIEAQGAIEKVPKLKDGKPVVGKDGKPFMKTVPSKGSAAEKTMKIVQDVWAQPIVTPTTGREWVMPIDLKVGERWSDFG